MSNPIIRYGSAAIFFIIGVFLSFKAITSSVVGETSFIILLLISLCGAALLLFSDRIKIIDLMRLRLTLHQVRTKEQNIKRIASLVTELAFFFSETLMLTETQDGEETDYNRILSELKKLTSQK